MTDLDPKFTFDSFVVGPANRLASAAARRAADSPGTSYNPLFIYSAPGLGKSHILHAIANQSAKADGGRKVEYQPLESYLEELEKALEAGSSEDFKERYGQLDILLLDDVQFLTGQPEAQEMLLRTLDQLSTAGSQIVLASDRPPAEINGLDARLLSRFAGGLIVDIASPEYETRVAIIRKKADERGQKLESGVAEAVARFPVKNIRELGGALNKIFAAQDLEGRSVSPEEASSMMGEQGHAAAGDEGEGAGEFGAFVDSLTEQVAETVVEKEAPWRKTIRETVEAAEREGFATKRLAGYLEGDEPSGWKELVEKFKADVQRLRDIDKELDELENPWPDAAVGILNDPDRLDDAEALLASVRERQRPFPKLGDGPDLAKVKGFQGMAVKAAQQLVADEKPEYNPLYVWSGDGGLGRTLLGAAGRTYQAAHPDGRMAVTSVKEFAEDFIRALGEGVAGAWRERWWTADLLLVHGIEALSETERAQDEFFHLFEALKRRGARVMLVGDRPPSGIDDIDERLRSRFEGGLVLELEDGAADGDLDLVEAAPEKPEEKGLWGDDEEEGAAAPAAVATKPKKAPVEPVREPPKKGGAWFPSAENVVLVWPRLKELLIEELE